MRTVHACELFCSDSRAAILARPPKEASGLPTVHAPRRKLDAGLRNLVACRELKLTHPANRNDLRP